MLSRFIPALIISLIIFGTIQVVAIDDDFDYDYFIENTDLLIGPGENTSILFQISCSFEGNYNGPIDIPVPKIYTYRCYSNSTYHHLPTDEESYRYLVCSAYSKANLTEIVRTFVVPVNVTFENNATFYVSYTFSPPINSYNNNTVFFLQNIEDRTICLDVDTIEDVLDSFWWLLLIPFATIGLVCLFQAYESARRRRAREQRDERLRELRTRLRADYQLLINSELEPLSTYVPGEGLRFPPPTPPPPTVFKCINKKDEMREFVKGDGMFDMGIKKFKVPSFEEQIVMMSKLPEVEKFNSEALEVLVNLNEYGRYFLKLRASPTVYRIESDESISHRNPYIHADGFGLCLGNAINLYNRCYRNKNYIECVRVLCKVLKSEHGSGYRKWSDCGR